MNTQSAINTILLTPEGERIVAAVAAGDFTSITERQYTDVTKLAHRLAKIATTTALLLDIRGAVVVTDKHDIQVAKDMQRARELGIPYVARPITPADEVRHFGHTRGHDIDPRARAVRQVVEANGLLAAAAEFLGHAAVDEILSSLKPPRSDEAAA